MNCIKDRNNVKDWVGLGLTDEYESSYGLSRKCVYACIRCGISHLGYYYVPSWVLSIHRMKKSKVNWREACQCTRYKCDCVYCVYRKNNG